MVKSLKTDIALIEGVCAASSGVDMAGQ